ncbi:MAG: 50S ribosomal protein L20 [Candidatus Firestonebacteria bacterium]|nr:50S ribosomal protein L20 [Candidatus Firestonebacteria bacterium]
MPRVKSSSVSRKKKKKVFKLAKGYYGGKSRLSRTAQEAVARALVYAYRDRKVRKREFRKIWITRINAKVRENGLTYNHFINGLKKSNININRKILAEMAVFDDAGFNKLISIAKEAQGA